MVLTHSFWKICSRSGSLTVHLAILFWVVEKRDIKQSHQLLMNKRLCRVFSKTCSRSKSLTVVTHAYYVSKINWRDLARFFWLSGSMVLRRSILRLFLLGFFNLVLQRHWTSPRMFLGRIVLARHIMMTAYHVSKVRMSFFNWCFLRCFFLQIVVHRFFPLL